jgi:hypothetical protein
MADYIEYRGWKYSPLGNGKWIVTLPSGMRSVVEAADEGALKANIDEAVEASDEG